MGSKIPYPEASGLFLRQIETDPVACPVSVKARRLSTNFCQVRQVKGRLRHLTQAL
jgi:hypothetical protein